MTNTPTGKLGSESADVTITSSTAARLVELLEHCERFLRTAGPVVRTELDTFLAEQPALSDANWLIDMLGFNALYLQGKLAPTHHTVDHTVDQGDRP
jgi:hypothetical protein